MTNCVARLIFMIIIATGCNFAFGVVRPGQTEAAKLVTCQRLYQKNYLHGGLHKAIATSGGRSLSSPNTACGFADGTPTKKQAIAAH